MAAINSDPEDEQGFVHHHATTPGQGTCVAHASTFFISFLIICG